MQRQLILLLSIFSLCLCVGCSVNPVTGNNEINIVSLSQQQAIGQQQYGPSQQSQGGEFQTDPELSAYVNTVGQRLAAVSDLKLDYEFVVLNNSVPNAWALPGGKIAVNRGLLLELENEAELAAVLGHEVVHAAAGHGALAMTRGTLLQGVLAVGAIASRDNEYADYIVGASTLGAQLITQRYGREAERESDYYGIHYMLAAGYDPNAAVSLQQTFVRLSEGQSSGWVDGLFASHPPSQERVDNNRALVSELAPQILGRDLELGEARYQQATAWLKASKPAYELFDEAELAIADDDLEIAYGNLEEAIKDVPDEARFYGLQGDILVYQRRYRAAIEKYDEALEKDKDYFDYYLGRGVAHARLNQRSEAKADLEHSSRLLPTAIAQNELGKLSLVAGQRNEAKQYFQNAAEANGSVGREALLAFTTLDVADNPMSYVQTQLIVNDDGRIFVRLSNNSPIALSAINLDVVAIINGSIERGSVQQGVLQSNTLVTLATPLRFSEGTLWTKDMMNVTVTSVVP